LSKEGAMIGHIVSEQEVKTNITEPALRSLLETMKARFELQGAEYSKTEHMVRDYFAHNAKSAYEITHNADSADCWINARERDLLAHDKDKLARALESLIKDGFLSKDMLAQADPYADGAQAVAGKTLGARSGLSLAFDLAVGKKFNATFSANDFQVEAFESWIRGSQTVAVFNGFSEFDKHNGSPSVQKLLSDPRAASGVSCSLRWLDTADSKHTYHVVSIDKIARDEHGDMRVYFYQSVSIPGIAGPDRKWEGQGGLESMTVKEFEERLRVMWVPDSTAQALSIHRVVDPAYFRAQPHAARAETEAQYRDGNNHDVYDVLSLSMLRYFEEQEQNRRKKSNNERPVAIAPVEDSKTVKTDK
jgi:hypothetical protein